MGGHPARGVKKSPDVLITQARPNRRISCTARRIFAKGQAMVWVATDVAHFEKPPIRLGRLCSGSLDRSK